MGWVTKLGVFHVKLHKSPIARQIFQPNWAIPREGILRRKKLLFGKCRLEIGYSFRGASLSCFRSKLIDIVLTMWCVRRVTEWYSLLLLSLTQAISGDILPSLTNDSFNRENFVKPLEMDIAQMMGGGFAMVVFISFISTTTMIYTQSPSQ